jgi:dolichol-phosphate mannosyltransferase
MMTAQTASATTESGNPCLSVVIPAYNEEENLIPLAEEVIAALSFLPGGFELILVDDASTDSTARVIEQFRHPQVRGVFHRINCGQSAAVASGFQAARGEFVATLDGDGQNDPADLPAMLEQLLKNGVDCLTGVRTKRQDNFIRRFSSKVANAFRNWITGDQVSDSGCGIRVVRRSALREIPVFNGMHRFMPTLLRGQGFSVEETTVNHRERLRGTSKYGVHNRLWRGLRDCFGIRWYVKRAVRSDRLGEARK